MQVQLVVFMREARHLLADVVNLENSKNGAREKEQVEELPWYIFQLFLFLSSLLLSAESAASAIVLD